MLTQGKADLKGYSGLAGSCPLCGCRTDHEEKTISSLWSRERRRLPSLSPSISFSLPLNIIKGFYFHEPSSMLPFREDSRPFCLCSCPTGHLASFYTLLHLLFLLPPNTLTPFSPPYLYSAATSSLRLLITLPELEPPTPNLSIPGPPSGSVLFSQACAKLQPASHLTYVGVYGLSPPTQDFCNFFIHRFFP